MTDSDPGTARTEPDNSDNTTTESATGGRDIVVPMRLYKTVTVFSTLLAVVSVVIGFLFLDAATLNVSLVGDIVRLVLAGLNLSVPESLLSSLFAVIGLSSIGLGAGVYVIGTRFRAQGMGKSQEDASEFSDTNG
ncbi:hypothetical protein [Haloquadratum walsbyi]|jgi:hypothetical protein|uniref:DUF7315 domain-containing protein n=1 Tax=Haloquadratum walsbyi J07HQW2 TaxID=1238425 RepID=U1PVW1_9EURY|nr:hypothetical protein [Haloquadratum walsbyi]ERG96556.1 MAG: hypothetical protein J07HQW2_03036 [Haloquadratum walsbyi J07HQW2]